MNRSHEHALLLLNKARDDARALVRLAEDILMPSWVLGFHAQQAVEKALKSVLTSKSIEYPRTHNISLLLDLLQTHSIDLPPDAQSLPELTPYGVVMRYDGTPDEGISLSFDWASAVACAQRTIDWAAVWLEKEDRPGQ